METGHLKEMAGPGLIKCNKSDMERKPHLFSHMQNLGLILQIFVSVPTYMLKRVSVEEGEQESRIYRT